MSTITSLTASQLRQAASIKDKLEKLQSELARLVGGSAAAPEGAPKRRLKFSAAARAKIAAAQKARWAKFHTSQKASAKPAKPAKKRTMSAAARAKIAAAAKARWAKAKASGKKTL